MSKEKMDDLTMTRLCAEALGVANEYPWNPLVDDAQVMAMVKKFGLWISKTNVWRCVEPTGFNQPDGIEITNNNLNRAIVECVAKMQQAKEST